MRRHRAQHLADDIAPCLDALARRTASGQSLAHAISEVSRTGGPFAEHLRGLATQHSLGVPLHRAVAALRRDDAGAEERLAITTLEVLARLGGAVPSALDRAAVAVRDRRTIAADRKACAAQARISAAVLSMLPALVAVWTTTNDARIAHFIVHENLGRTCTAAAVLLNAAGWFWMRSLVGRST